MRPRNAKVTIDERTRPWTRVLEIYSALMTVAQRKGLFTDNYIADID